MALPVFNSMQRAIERDPTATDHDQIKWCLAKIVGSATFARSDRLRRFLSHTVAAVMEGDPSRLKESIIGIEVFDRGPSYDPKIDPIVRIEARRLRARLTEYYEAEGSDDPVVIEVPKGGYTPTFTPRARLSASDSPRAYPARYAILVGPGKRGHRNGPLITLAAVVACLAAVTVAIFALREPAARRELRVLGVTSDPGQEFSPALSPDGQRVAFVASKAQGNFDIYVKSLAANTTIRLTTDTAHDLRPAFSPDGAHIAFVRLTPAAKQIIVKPADGSGSERTLLRTHTGSGEWLPDASQISYAPGPAWTNDGKHLIFPGQVLGLANSEAIASIPILGGAPRAITTPPQGFRDGSPVAAPTGDAIAFRRTAGLWTDDIHLATLAGGRATRLTSDGKQLRGLAWNARDGSIVFSSKRAGNFQLWSVPVSGGSPSPVPGAGRNAIEPSLSRDGRRLVYTEFSNATSIWRVALGPGTRGVAGPGKLISSSRRSEAAQYSPDGTRIAFTSDRSGNWEIWIADSGGRNAIQLTSLGSATVGSPRWSPDGKMIAFDVSEGSSSGIYVVSPDEGGQRRLTGSDTKDWMPTWSADSRSVYFTSSRGGELQLWKQDVHGGTAVRVTNGQASDAAEDQTGRFLYYGKRTPGLFRLDFATGVEEPVPGLANVRHGRYWVLTRDGIYFLDQQTPPRQIRFYNFATRASTPVATVPSGIVPGTPSLSVSPDGRWLLFAQEDHVESDIVMIEHE